MFSFHWPELFILVLVALIIFGPKRLPEIGSSVGKAMKGFKKELVDSESDTGSKDPTEAGH